MLGDVDIGDFGVDEIVLGKSVWFLGLRRLSYRVLLQSIVSLEDSSHLVWSADA